MNEDNMFVMMTASHSVDTRRFMIIYSTLSILIVIALSVIIWLVWHILSTANGVQTAPSTKQCQSTSQHLGVLEKPQLTTVHLTA